MPHISPKHAHHDTVGPVHVSRKQGLKPDGISSGQICPFLLVSVSIPLPPAPDPIPLPHPPQPPQPPPPNGPSPSHHAPPQPPFEPPPGGGLPPPPPEPKPPPVHGLPRPPSNPNIGPEPSQSPTFPPINGGGGGISPRASACVWRRTDRNIPSNTILNIDFTGYLHYFAIILFVLTIRPLCTNATKYAPLDGAR